MVFDIFCPLKITFLKRPSCFTCGEDGAGFPAYQILFMVDIEGGKRNRLIEWKPTTDQIQQRTPMRRNPTFL